MLQVLGGKLIIKTLIGVSKVQSCFVYVCLCLTAIVYYVLKLLTLLQVVITVFRKRLLGCIILIPAASTDISYNLCE